MGVDITFRQAVLRQTLTGQWALASAATYVTKQWRLANAPSAPSAAASAIRPVIWAVAAAASRLRHRSMMQGVKSATPKKEPATSTGPICCGTGANPALAKMSRPPSRRVHERTEKRLKNIRKFLAHCFAVYYLSFCRQRLSTKNERSTQDAQHQNSLSSAPARQ